MIAWAIFKPVVHPAGKDPVLVGYGRLEGGEPVFLPAEDVGMWDDSDAWMDLDAWRRWIGGTLTDHLTRPVCFDASSEPGRLVPKLLG